MGDIEIALNRLILIEQAEMLLDQVPRLGLTTRHLLPEILARLGEVSSLLDRAENL